MAGINKDDETVTTTSMMMITPKKSKILYKWLISNSKAQKQLCTSLYNVQQSRSGVNVHFKNGQFCKTAAILFFTQIIIQTLFFNIDTYFKKN